MSAGVGRLDGAERLVRLAGGQKAQVHLGARPAAVMFLAA